MDRHTARLLPAVGPPQANATGSASLCTRNGDMTHLDTSADDWACRRLGPAFVGGPQRRFS